MPQAYRRGPPLFGRPTLWAENGGFLGHPRITREHWLLSRMVRSREGPGVRPSSGRERRILAARKEGLVLVSTADLLAKGDILEHEVGV